VAFDFEPTVSAVEALRDGRRRLRWPAIALHLDPPCGLGAVGIAYSFGSALARSFRAYLTPHCGDDVRIGGIERPRIDRLDGPS
jgi:hypothetical protein